MGPTKAFFFAQNLSVYSLSRLARSGGLFILAMRLAILFWPLPFQMAKCEANLAASQENPREQANANEPGNEQLIGAIYSLSGWAKQGGDKELAGLTFAIDELNERGGLLGKKIKLKVEDNASDVKTTVSAVQRLTKISGVPVIFGPNYAEFSEVVAPIAQREQTIMISSSGFTKTLTLNRPYIFTTLPAHSFLTAPLAAYIKSHNIRSIAIFKTNSAYLDSIAESFNEQLKPLEVNVFNFNPGETDFRSGILKAKSAKVDAILLTIIQGDISTFLRQLRALKLEAPLFSTNSILFDDGVKLEPKLADRLTLYDYSVSIPEAPRVRFIKKYGYEPRDNVARTFAAFEAWSQSVARCNSFNPTIIRGCLSDGKFETVVGPLKFDASNNVIPQGPIVNLLRFEDGSLKAL